MKKKKIITITMEQVKSIMNTQQENRTKTKNPPSGGSLSL